MRKVRVDPEMLLPLTASEFQILLALAGGQRHGYAIMKEVEKESEGKLRLGPGTLYGSVKRMLAAGLIEESSGAQPGSGTEEERRRYYSLTPFGARVATAEAERLAALTELARARSLIPSPGMKG